MFQERLTLFQEPLTLFQETLTLLLEDVEDLPALWFLIFGEDIEEWSKFQQTLTLFQESLSLLVEVDLFDHFQIFDDVVDVVVVVEVVPSGWVLRFLVNVDIIFDNFQIFYDVVDVEVVDVEDVEVVSVRWRLTLLVGVITEDVVMFVKLVTTSFPRAARSAVVDMSAADLQRSCDMLRLTT